MLNQSHEQALKRQLKEIERENEAFEREKVKLYEGLDMTPEEMHQALRDPSRYSKEDWKRLQELKKEMEELLDRDLKNIRNPEKAKAAYESRNLPPWALFCR